MSEPIGALRADIVANSAQFAADMKAARDAVQTAAAHMQRTFAQLQKGANRAVSEIFNMRNAAGVLAVAALTAFVRQNVKAAAEMDDTAQRLGINVERFQELSYAAKIAGIEQEDFTKALEQFNKRMGDFSGNVSEAQKALGQLGLSMADLRDKTPDEKFKLVADGMARIEDPARRAAIAADLFSKTGVKLLNVLTDGSAGLAKYAEEARRLGFILSKETIKKAAEADDEFDRIGKSLKVAGINIAAGFLPALTEIRKVVTSQEFQDGIKSASASLGQFVKLMVDNRDTIVMVATAFAGMKLGGALGSGFGKRGEVLGAITGALAGLAAGAEIAGEKVDQAITRITINKAPPPNPFSPETAQAIDDLIFRARILKGDFDQLAQGFPEMARGLKQFGLTANENRTSVELLAPQLQKLNETMLIFKGAQLTQEVLEPWEEYAKKIERIQQLLDAGAISQETFRRAIQKTAHDAGTSWEQAGGSIALSFAQIADSMAKENSTMAKVAKAFAIVAAIINAYEGASKALTLPFPANIAAAAVVLAKGFAFVAAIKSQNVPKFAMGGAFTVPGGIGGGDRVPVNFLAEPGERVTVESNRAPASTSAPQPIMVRMPEFISREMAIQMIRQINEVARDGYRLSIAPA